MALFFSRLPTIYKEKRTIMKEGYVHLYSGSTEFDQDYYGDAYKEPWLSETDENGDVNYNKVPDTDYLTFKITSGGNINWRASSNCPSDFKRTIEYSKNGGTWISISPNNTISVVAGDNVRFRGDNPSYGGSDVPYPERSEDYGLIYYNSFEGSTCGFEVYGNIMSLIDKDNFRTLVHFTETLVFYRLFYNCSKLTSAENLLFPATRLTDECYSHVFMNCTGMTGVPSFESTRLGKWCYDGAFENTGIVDASGIVLKARIMNEGCYQGMFCKNPRLRVLPVIKAKKLAYRCFYYMFGNCTGLESVPSNYLPWKTLADSCYDKMFMSTAITKIPDLPAKKLATDCYRYMFDDCAHLTGKINLQATILAPDCYQFMFYGTSAGTVNTPEVFIAAPKLSEKSFEHMLSGNKSIKKIICLATDISAVDSTGSFTYLLAAGGLFVKHPDMPVGVAGGWPRNINGIPTNWTYEDATYTDKKSIHLEMDGIEGAEFTVTSHLPWRFVSEVPWITAVPAAGESGTTHCTVYAEPASASRIGNLGIVTDYYAIKVAIEQNYFNNPLTFEILTAGNIVWSASDASIAKTIQYKINDSEEWTSITSTVAGVSIPVQAGDVVEFRGDNTAYAEVQYGTVNKYNSFTNSNCTFNAMGNIFSLVNSTGYTDYANSDTLPTDTRLAGLFYNCVALKDVSELHLNTKRTPEALFAATFQGCTSIATPPTLKTESLMNNCYQGMFKGCSNLTSVPDLPVTTVKSGCYADMFNGCVKLTTVQQILPATGFSQAGWCYASMYEGCTRITTAPELPAAVALPDHAYYKMFSGCTSLNHVKCMATGITSEDCTMGWLADVAPTGIFEENEVYTDWEMNSPNGIPTGWARDYGGEALKPLTFEVLTGGTIVYSLYDSGATPKTIEYSKNGGEWASITPTYEGVSIEVEAGDNVQFRGDNAAYAVNASDNNNTFNKSTATFNLRGNIMSLIDSTGFTTVTALTANYTFCQMFIHCYGLRNIDKLCLPARTLSNGCYINMFYDCSGLTSANIVIPADTMSTGSCRSMFYQCTSLTRIPKIVGATTIANTACQNMFAGCTSLVNASGVFGSDTSTFDASGCSYMFSGCTSLETAPNLNSLQTVSSASCYAMFYQCSSLVSIPATLRPTHLYANTYRSMFSGCSSITTAPVISATTLGGNCCRTMLANCTSLIKAPSILPATTLANDCYYGMFSGCTSLEVAPILPGKTSTTTCYAYMFSGCGSLNYINCQLTTITNSGDTDQWVANVSASGKFVKDPAMPVGAGGWTKDSVHGIPVGWDIYGDNTVASTTGIIITGGTKEIAITSDEPWTATTSDSWITLSQTTGDTGETNITITLTGAPTEGCRNGSIKFGYGDKVRVYQYVLPEDYTAVTCVSSTKSGGQWIDLGIKMFETAPVTFEAEGRAVIKGKGKDNNSYTTLINAKQEVSPYPGFSFRLRSSTTQVEWADVPYSQVLGTTGDVIDFKIKSPEPTTVESAITTTHNVSTTLFCSRNGSGTEYRFAEGSIYWLRLVSYETDMLLLPLINANGVAGLYEVVSGTFFTSRSSTPFTYTA